MDAPYIYAFSNDSISIMPKDPTDEQEQAFEEFRNRWGLQETHKNTYVWGNNEMHEVATAFQNEPALFRPADVLSTSVPAPAPKPVTVKTKEPQPALGPAPAVSRADKLRIQIGATTFEIPLDAQTAMMLAYTLQTYAQYQVLAQHPVPPAPAPAPAPTAPAPEKSKSKPRVPDGDNFDILNSMRGEMLQVHDKYLIKITLGQRVVAETRACDTRDEAYDIAVRFSRMIPGLTKPGEVVRK